MLKEWIIKLPYYELPSSKHIPGFITQGGGGGGFITQGDGGSAGIKQYPIHKTTDN